MFFTLLSTKNHIRLPNSIDNLRFLTTAISYCQKAGSIQHSDMKLPKSFFKVGVLNTRGCCKSFLTHVLLHSIFNTMILLLNNLYTQSTHFDNSKMVKWALIGQKLTKIQGIM